MYNVSLRQYKVLRDLDIDETGASLITGHRLCFGWSITNLDTVTVYLKLYNKASAPSASDTPLLTIPIPTLGMSVVEFMGGIDFPLGIGVRATTGVADNDTAGPGGNEVLGQILYR